MRGTLALNGLSSIFPKFLWNFLYYSYFKSIEFIILFALTPLIYFVSYFFSSSQHELVTFFSCLEFILFDDVTNACEVSLKCKSSFRASDCLNLVNRAFVTKISYFLQQKMMKPPLLANPFWSVTSSGLSAVKISWKQPLRLLLLWNST